MTTIYLVRHTEAEGNLYRLVQGHFDGLVTRRGYDQIRALRRRFEGIHIDAVYSSDLFRARTTARAVSEPRGLEIQLREELREVHLGWWEGLAWQTVAQKDPQQLEYFHLNPEKMAVRDGETGAQVRDRMMAALQSIAAENEGKTVAVFSHGAAIRILLGTIRGLALHEIDQSLLGDNTAVTLLEWENGQLREIYGNDNSHLVQAGLTKFVSRSGAYRVRFGEGMDYRALDAEAAAQLRGENLSVPEDGQCIAAWKDGCAVGLVQLLGCEDGVGVVGTYYLVPAVRRTGRGIQLMGQAVMRYRAEGCTRLRLADVPEEYQAYFARYGFTLTDNNAMEMSIGYEDREI